MKGKIVVLRQTNVEAPHAKIMAPVKMEWEHLLVSVRQVLMVLIVQIILMIVALILVKMARAMMQ